MILVRVVFQAKWGKGGELAQQMKAAAQAQAQQSAAHWRVLTDLGGPFNTVVMEYEAESLAAFEQNRQAMFTDPAWQAGFAQVAALVEGGRQEFFTIEAQG